MVEKPSLAVQLSDREPTVDTQGVEVYNEEGIEHQLMRKETGPGEPNGSLGSVFVLEIFSLFGRAKRSLRYCFKRVLHVVSSPKMIASDRGCSNKQPTPLCLRVTTFLVWSFSTCQRENVERRAIFKRIFFVFPLKHDTQLSPIHGIMAPENGERG